MSVETDANKIFEAIYNNHEKCAKENIYLESLTLEQRLRYLKDKFIGEKVKTIKIKGELAK